MAFFHDGALRPAQAASAVRRVRYELRSLPRAESALPFACFVNGATSERPHASTKTPLPDETASDRENCPAGASA